MAAIVAHHALRLPGRARGVEDVERVGGLERHAFDRASVRLGDRLRIVMIAAGDEVAALFLALQDEARFRLVLGVVDRRVEERLVADDAPGLDAAGGGDDELRLGVVDARRKLRRGEASEHDGVDRAEARAGEHRGRCFRDHRQIEDDAVALLDAEALQHGGERLHVGEKLAVADPPLLPGDGAVVDDRGRVGPPRGVAIDAIEAGVAFSTREPMAVDAEARVEDLVPGLQPVDLRRRYAGPEALRIAPPAFVDFVIAAGHSLVPPDACFLWPRAHDGIDFNHLCPPAGCNRIHAAG